MPKRVLASLLSLVMTSVAPAIVAQTKPANPDAVTLAEFAKAVKAYAALRDKLDGGAAALAETATQSKIAGAEEVLAQRIRAARADAKPGSIFTPEFQKKILALLRPELKGKEGAQTTESIRDENPGKMT